MSVSIIVPVFNVENYIEKCINSILNQTYKDIEILLIDDGSTDSSGEICEKYKKIDKRIKVFHKKNGGLSSSRNYGLEKINGEFVCFIDSDDYIDDDYIEKLYNSICYNNSDIAVSAKIIETSNNKKIYNSKNNWCLDSISALKKAFTFDDIDNSACDKLFSREIFNNIRFPLNKYYEDIGCIFYAIYNSKTVSHVKDTFYHYVNRNDSITKEKFSVRQLDRVEMASEIRDFFKNKEKDLSEASEAFYYISVMSLIEELTSSSDRCDFHKYELELKRNLKDNFFKIIKNKYIPFYKKIMIILLILNQEMILALVKRVMKK